jgi:hypothetical protein
MLGDWSLTVCFALGWFGLVWFVEGENSVVNWKLFGLSNLVNGNGRTGFFPTRLMLPMSMVPDCHPGSACCFLTSDFLFYYFLVGLL